MSTTQVLCGAIFAIGLFEGGKGLNWRVALKVGSAIAARTFDTTQLHAWFVLCINAATSVTVPCVL